MEQEPLTFLSRHFEAIALLLSVLVGFVGYFIGHTMSVRQGSVDILDHFEAWPDDFNDRVRRDFDRVRAEHIRLLGRVRGQRRAAS